MSILASQNIYGNAANRIEIEIDNPGGSGLKKGDVVTEKEKEGLQGGTTTFKETSIAPSQRGGTFGGPTSYENDTQRGIARYYRADAEAPNKTDRSTYAVPDNASGPYNGTSARNIVSDDPVGTTRLSMFAKGAGAASAQHANAAMGENALTIGNKLAVGLDDSTGGNTSRAAISFIGDGYNEWVNIGNVSSGSYGVTKTSGGHEFKNSYSPDLRYLETDMYDFEALVEMGYVV